MAKKSKKISVSVDKLVYAGIALLALVALCLIFAPAVTLDYALLTGTYKGTEVVFGLEDSFAFSFMNLLTYLLLLGGVVMYALKLAGAKSKLFDLLGAGLLIAAGVLFFFVLTFIVPANTLTETVLKNGENHLLAGPIVSGILCLLGGACGLCYALLGRK